MIQIDFHSPAPLPNDEAARQRAVERTGIFTRRGDKALQQIVDTAAEMFKAPIAAVSVIDRERQWFVARVGLEPEETPRAISFCAHAIHKPGEALVVSDARRDLRFAGNPLVKFAPHIRFYAGIPLVDLQGYPLGALCVVDSKPRPDAPDLFELSLLARQAERLIAR